MSVSDLERHDSKNLIFEDHIILGYNYRLTDIQAAIGIAQLKVKNIISKRRKIANHYFEILKDIEEIILPVEPEFAKSNWQSFCIRFCDNLERNKIMQHLKSKIYPQKQGSCVLTWIRYIKLNLGDQLVNFIKVKKLEIKLYYLPF